MIDEFDPNYTDILLSTSYTINPNDECRCPEYEQNLWDYDECDCPINELYGLVVEFVYHKSRLKRLL